MADLYSDIPSLGAKERAILRRQKIAEQLMAQSQTPLETNQMAGGYVVPVSPLAGIAKLVQAYAGQKQASDQDKQYGELANERTKMVADEMAKMEATRNGTPAVTEQVQGEISPAVMGNVPVPQPADRPDFNTMQGEVSPAVQGMVTKEVTPAVAGDPRKAVMNAMMSQLPEMQKYGLLQETHMNRQEDQKIAAQDKKDLAIEAAKTRMAELEFRLQDSRLNQQERLAMQKELAVMNHDTQVAIANQASEDRLFLGNQASEDRRAAIESKSTDAKSSERKISNIDAKSIDKSLVKSSDANSALQLLDQADALYDKYNSDKAEPILGTAARWGAAVGLGNKQKAQDYETGDQIAKDLGVIKLGLIGGSDTERELQVAIDTSPSPDKLPATNKNIIANQRRAIEVLQAEPDFKTEWVNKHGSLSSVDNQNGDTYGKAWRKYQKDNFKPVSEATDKPNEKTGKIKKPASNVLKFDAEGNEL